MVDRDLDFEPHLEHYKMIFGYGSHEIREHVHKKAQHAHALIVFDALRDFAYDMIELSYKLRTNDGAYYMRYGAGRRLLMMWRSYRTITIVAPPCREEPLSDDEETTLSRDINVIYMHLRGVSDNFAWCFLYEKEQALVQKLSKQHVSLFSASIKKETAFPEFWNEVGAHGNWAAEIAERRDPVAHRIPLYIPPAAITDKEATQYRELTGEFFEGANRMDFEASNAASERLQRIGRFVPCFVHHPEAGIVPLYPTLSQDMVHVIEIGRTLEGYIT